eukprot:TRINITY_DN7264_c0_g1_i1.p2 TRINITY_DN7264_c0_g1~~TRINITY_DN7264_c0_g1_i1.p2  ORF type:complete len:64 (-),score=10.50 TRINITY_DN7264_c0_g1_i1:2-193(-)
MSHATFSIPILQDPRRPNKHEWRHWPRLQPKANKLYGIGTNAIFMLVPATMAARLRLPRHDRG